MGSVTEKIGPASVKERGLSAKTLADLVDKFADMASAGHVQWAPVYSCTPKGGPLTGVAITVPITMEMPKWSPPPTVGPKAIAEWKRAKEALRAHEDGHVKLVKNHFGGLAKKMIGLSESDAADIFQTAVDDLQTASDSYDTKTDHGRKTGAVIDVSIEEDEQAELEKKKEKKK